MFPIAMRRGVSRLIAVFRRAIQDTDLGALMRRSAAIAYYSALSLAPLLVVALAVAGLAFDRAAVRTKIVGEMQRFVGAEGATLVATVLDRSGDRNQASFAAIVGVFTLLMGATAVFVELQDALNATWDVPRSPRRGLWTFVRQRLLSLAMVFSLAFLLLVSMIVTAALSAITDRLDLGGVAVVGVLVHFVVNVGVTTLLFAVLFKFLPDVKVPWRDVFLGAVTTSVLFYLGQLALAQYLGRSAVGSAYGAAGSFVIILVWVYYSAAIVLFGAEVTQAWTRRPAVPRTEDR
jgi:membrane protein